MERRRPGGTSREDDELASDAPALREPGVPWDKVLALLGERLGERRCAVWFGGSEALWIEDGVLLVELRTPLAVDWVQNHHYQDVQAAVREATGRSLTVRFVPARNH
jgi:chromosomal replication initiation ATPase DnaA